MPASGPAVIARMRQLFVYTVGRPQSSTIGIPLEYHGIWETPRIAALRNLEDDRA